MLKSYQIIKTDVSDINDGDVSENHWERSGRCKVTNFDDIPCAWD